MKLNQYEYENLFDCINSIEADFSIHFEESELETLSNFDELVELTVSKINLTDTQSCTKQQAFYKLRKAILDLKKLDPATIHPKTELFDVFNRKKIRSEIKLLEQKLGLELHIMNPSEQVIRILTMSTVFSVALLFIHIEIGIISLIFSLAAFKLAYMINRKPNITTIGELAKTMTDLHYLKARRDPNTVNKSELRKVFWNLFSEYIGIEQQTLQTIHFK